MRDLSWSKREKQIAHTAFELALDREAAALVAEVRAKARAITELDDLWLLERFLRDKRRAFEERYDYRYSVLLYVFADLIQAGWLSLDELAGLSDDKRTRVAALLEFAHGDGE
jgi:Photoprotection regulator fluorescence recovery protein